MYLLNAKTPSSFTYISSGRFLSEGLWIHDKRNLDTAVLVVGLMGTLYIQQGDHKYEVCPGDVLLLLPHVTHFGYKVSEEPVSYFWCHFTTNHPFIVLEEDTYFKDKQVLMSRDSTDLINKTGSVAIPVYHHYERMNMVNVMFNQLLAVTSLPKYIKAIADHYLNIIMLELSQRYLCDYLQSHNVEKNRRFFEIAEWLRANLDKNITISDVSKKFNYNPNYLSRLFKCKTGMHLQKYITNIKMEKARDLLLDTNRSVKEIAFCLGFSDEKYFMKLFKSSTNVTPTQYRNVFPYTHMNNH